MGPMSIVHGTWAGKEFEGPNEEKSVERHTIGLTL